MSICHRTHLLSKLLLPVLLLCAGSAPCPAQSAGSHPSPDVSALLKQLKSDDRDVTNAAQENLEKIGRPAVRPLLEFLRYERKCRPRVRAAEVLLELAPDEEAIVPTMVEVIQTYCYF